MTFEKWQCYCHCHYYYLLLPCMELKRGGGGYAGDLDGRKVGGGGGGGG